MRVRRDVAKGNDETDTLKSLADPVHPLDLGGFRRDRKAFRSEKVPHFCRQIMVPAGRFALLYRNIRCVNDCKFGYCRHPM
jgi:hypothetical protein